MAEPLFESSAARSARERLEQTRRELLRHMSQDDHRRAHGGDAGLHADDHEAWDDTAPPHHDDPHGGSTWQNLRHTASAWWQSHPAHLALEVAEPVFEKYARAHPMRVLALSATAGAALVLARPWRLISVTGLLVAALKSTQMSALAASLLRPRSSEPLRRHPREQAREQDHQAWPRAEAQAHDRTH